MREILKRDEADLAFVAGNIALVAFGRHLSRAGYPGYEHCGDSHPWAMARRWHSAHCARWYRCCNAK